MNKKIKLTHAILLVLTLIISITYLINTVNTVETHYKERHANNIFKNISEIESKENLLEAQKYLKDFSEKNEFTVNSLAQLASTIQKIKEK